jgi:hypothetical protein
MHNEPTTYPSGRRRRRLSGFVVAAMALASVVVGASTVPGQPAQAAGVSANDWLGIVNTYRAQSGLNPVTENGWWSAGARNHSCWMLLNGIAHDEAPGTPGYSVEGDQAGNSGNVAVSSNPSATPRSHIDLWMTGPFHAIGVLRSSLSQTAFGLCSSPPNPSTTTWKSAATLDVVRGNNWGAPKPSTPVVFPGNGATTNLTRFIAESPDPRTFCGWSGRSVGLPLIALMPSTVNSASATLRGPNGPISTCVLHKNNTSGVASSILSGDNAVVVVPAAPLATGTYSVSVSSSGGAASWSFKVDPNAPFGASAPLPDSQPLASEAGFQPVTPYRFADSRSKLKLTRLVAGRETRVRLAGTTHLPGDTTAISASFTITKPSGSGYLTAYNCPGGVPSVSTLNYGPWETVSNQAIVPLDKGDLCLYSSRNADIVIDVNGYVSPSGTQIFTPVKPKRLMDSRPSGKIRARTRTAVKITGGSSPVPAGATAVALNLVGVSPDTDGWIRAYPCDEREPGVSSVSARRFRAIANSVIVPLADNGTICLSTMMNTHVVLDVTGWFGPSGGSEFIPVDPIRMADTRSYDRGLNSLTSGRMLPAGKVLEIGIAGARGLPSGATAATVNIVALGASKPGWLRVVPCGSSSDISTLNFSSPSPIANGSNVKLSSKGSICIVGMTTSHVVVDVTGVWK